jgi:hypothetical protein
MRRIDHTFSKKKIDFLMQENGNLKQVRECAQSISRIKSDYHMDFIHLKFIPQKSQERHEQERHGKNGTMLF